MGILGTATCRIPPVVSIVSPFFSYPPRYDFAPLFKTPPRSLLARVTAPQAGVCLLLPRSPGRLTFSSRSSSGDSPPPPASGGHSLNTAVIASSVSSGVVTICLAIASIFCYLRRRRRRPRAPPTVSTVPAGVGASKPQVDEILLPVTYERISLSGQPRSYIRMVVRDFALRVALVTSSTAFFRTLRTQMTLLRSRRMQLICAH